MVKFWDFVGKQLARLRFGVTYIQMIYYASVILGALVLVTDRIFGEGTIGWIDSLLIIGGIFILEWLLGYYTERMGVIKKDVLQTMKQKLPGRRMVEQEVWSVIQVPLIEEMTERVLRKTLESFTMEIMEELEQTPKNKKSK